MRNVFLIIASLAACIAAAPLKKRIDRGWDNPIFGTHLRLVQFASPGVYETFVLNGATYGLMVSYPPDYVSNPTKKYPVILFVVGSGETGSNPVETYKNGPNWALSQGWDGNVTVGDSTWRPIIITLQPPAVTTSRTVLARTSDTLMARYRIDSMRMYVTGLSMGGQMINQAEMYYGTSGSEPPFWKNKRWTASVVFSTPNPTNTFASYDSLVQYGRYGGHYYYAIGASDNVNYIQPAEILPQNNTVPGFIRAFRYTTPSGSGHCCWNYFYDPAWRDTLLNLSVYQWMFQYTKYPSASAQNIVNTSSSVVTLNGVTSGWGKVVSWTQLTGAASTISSPSSDTTNVTGLTNGTYTYRLRSRNGTGPTFVDHTVTVIVNTDNPNTPAGKFQKKRGQKFKLNQI